MKGLLVHSNVTFLYEKIISSLRNILLENSSKYEIIIEAQFRFTDFESLILKFYAGHANNWYWAYAKLGYAMNGF